jgi:hypothetical protein
MVRCTKVKLGGGFFFLVRLPVVEVVAARDIPTSAGTTTGKPIIAA